MGNRIEGISRSIQHKQRELEIVQTRLSEAQKKEKARRENLQHLGTQEEKLREELDRIAREEVELAVKKEELSQAVNRLAGEGSKLSNRVHEIELQRIRLMQEEEANMETTTRQNRVTVYIHRYFWIILAIIFVAVLSVVLLFANGCSCSAKSDRAVIRITDAETAIAGSVDFSDTRRKTGIPEDSNAIGPTKRTFSADIPTPPETLQKPAQLTTPEPNLAPSLPLVYVPVQPEPTEKQESVQSAKPTLPEKCPDKESPPGQNSDAASALNQLAQIPVKNWWPTPADMFVVEDRRYVFPPSGEHSPTTLRIYLKEKASDYRIIIQTSLEGISSQDKTEILNAREMNFPEIPEFLYSREVIEYGGKYYFFLISKTPLIVKR